MDVEENDFGEKQFYNLGSIDYTKNVPYKISLVEDILRHEKVKKALGVNGSCDKECEIHCGIFDEEEKVLLYQGKFDLRDGVVSIEAWVKTTKWEGINMFLSVDQKVWKVGKSLLGMFRNWVA
ncbi:hypothetical protein CerSpe_172360 [Prunus speciosa]